MANITEYGMRALENIASSARSFRQDRQAQIEAQKARDFQKALELLRQQAQVDFYEMQRRDELTDRSTANAAISEGYGAMAGGLGTPEQRTTTQTPLSNMMQFDVNPNVGLGGRSLVTPEATIPVTKITPAENKWMAPQGLSPEASAEFYRGLGPTIGQQFAREATGEADIQEAGEAGINWAILSGKGDLTKEIVMGMGPAIETAGKNLGYTGRALSAFVMGAASQFNPNDYEYNLDKILRQEAEAGHQFAGQDDYVMLRSQGYTALQAFDRVSKTYGNQGDAATYESVYEGIRRAASVGGRGLGGGTSGKPSTVGYGPQVWYIDPDTKMGNYYHQNLETGEWELAVSVEPSSGEDYYSPDYDWSKYNDSFWADVATYKAWMVGEGEKPTWWDALPGDEKDEMNAAASAG